MHKRISGKKLNRTSNERVQLLRQLVSQLVANGAIKTSVSKAKFVKPNVEKWVTTAKDGSLTGFRSLVKKTGNVDIARSLLEYGKLFAKRPGGYTRIVRLTEAKGDNSEIVRLEWVEQLVKTSQVKIVKKSEEIAPKVTQTPASKIKKLPKNAKTSKTIKTQKAKK